MSEPLRQPQWNKTPRERAAMRKATGPVKAGQGLSHWPEFDWVLWPVELPPPRANQVIKHAYHMAGLDCARETDRDRLKRSRGAYKALVACAGLPILIRVCRCSAMEAGQSLGIRSLRRCDDLYAILQTPATKQMVKAVLQLLVIEQEEARSRERR